jgi:hypothetical protein
VLADNAPALPDAYAYGDDGTAVSESDTALGNEIEEVSLTEILIQSADTQAEWEDIFPAPASDEPFTIDATGPGMEQIAWTTEGENFDRGQTGFDDTTNSGDYSNTDYFNGTRGDDAADPGDFAEWDFVPQHTIPASEFGVRVRDASPTTDAPGVRWVLITPSGESFLIDEFGFGVGLLSNPGWANIGDGFYNGVRQYDGPDLTAGQTYTLRLDITDSNGNLDGTQYNVDVVAPYDKRSVGELTFDETLNANDALSGPELYEQSIVKSLNTADTRRNVTEASFTSAWNDVSNNQYVELANDGSTFTRFNNSDTGSVTFASPDRGVDTNLNFSRYTSDATTTPATGDSGQRIDSWELTANPDAVVPDDISETLTRAVVSPGTLTGDTIREAGLKSGSTLLTRHVLAEFTVESGQRIASAESTTFTGDN